MKLYLTSLKATCITLVLGKPTAQTPLLFIPTVTMDTAINGLWKRIRKPLARWAKV